MPSIFGFCERKQKHWRAS